MRFLIEMQNLEHMANGGLPDSIPDNLFQMFKILLLKGAFKIYIWRILILIDSHIMIVLEWRLAACTEI